MALRGETYTARPKRSSDGAVSAKYRKTGTQSKAEERLAQKLISDKLTAKAPERGQKAAQKKAVERKKTDRQEAAPRAAQRKTAERKTAEKKTAEKKAPVHRAVMATPGQAQRAKKDKAREPGRVRRERKRIDAAMRDRRRAVSRGVDTRVVLIALLTAAFVTGGLLLAAVRGTDGPDLQALSLIALMVPLGLLTSLALPRVLPIDPLIMALTNFLCGVGVVVLYTVSPARGVRQASYYALGLAAMVVVSVLISRKKRFKGLTLLAMVLGVAALILPLAFGEWSGGAKNWVELPYLGSFQPSELVKLSLVLAMAYYFSAHRTVLQMMPAILFAGACLLLLMLQRDLGTALIYYATTLAMFYVACGNVPLTIVGLGGGVGAAVLGYKMFAHVKVRVAMWRNPWSDPLDKGYQIIQALLAIGSGGLFGVG
ncbi:MAG: FtsW/RodA/SpoVE family cell cycle protein, partial [Candidatus Ventricola sp.]